MSYLNPNFGFRPFGETRATGGASLAMALPRFASHVENT